ncbi:MAG: AAC(3) family N-acetyltransferase [Burkholderiales bacterium]|nr:AAC(3) family N-acetyltransferase [Burkholderiales bacterium]
MGPVELLSGWALRRLDARRVEVLRERYFRLRGRVAPLLRIAYGHFDSAALRQHLEERVGRNFEILMVHSSVNHMKPMYDDGALDFVRMLIEFCGPERTLAMPAFYFGEPGSGGARPTFEKQPRFDLRRTPSQMGLATELFRRMPGVKQSRHPVYRIAARGPLADELTRGHEFASSPAGRGSPFETMVARDTLILGIGKPVQVLTQAHHTEEWMRDEFPLPSGDDDPLLMTLVDGREEIPFQLVGRRVDGRFNIWRIRRIMTSASLHEWQFHHVPMFATRAAEVTRQTVEAARRGVTLYEPA